LELWCIDEIDAVAGHVHVPVQPVVHDFDIAVPGLWQPLVIAVMA
jgi:hypothetical protein